MSDKTKIRDMIVDAGKKGLTLEEISLRAKKDPKIVNETLRRLALDDSIVDSQKRRKNRRGQKAVVWISTKFGEPVKERPPKRRKENAMQVKELEKKNLDRVLKMCKVLMIFQTKEIVLTLAVEEDGLVLSASSGGCIVRGKVYGKGTEIGTALVDMDHLMGLHLLGGRTAMRLNRSKLEIQSGRANYKVSQVKGKSRVYGVPTSDKATVQVEAGVLLSAIKTIWFSHDDSGTNDLRMGWGKGRFRMETADEFRGVVYDKKMPMWDSKPISKAIVPKKVIDGILSCFPKDQLINLDVTESALRVYDDENYISVPLVTTSALPEVRQVITAQTKRLKRSTANMMVEGRDFADLTGAAASVIQDNKKYASAQAVLEVSDGHISMRTEGDVGSFATRIPVNDLKGKKAKAVVLCRSLKSLSSLASDASGDGIQFEVWQRDLIVLKNTGKDYRALFAIPQLQD
jgi:hypothetical protein